MIHSKGGVEEDSGSAATPSKQPVQTPKTKTAGKYVMHWTLRLLLAPATLITLGIAIMVLGIALTFNGYANRIPERLDLARIAGTVQNITKLANRRQGQESFVRYELELAPADKLILTEEKLAAMKLDQSQLQALKGKAIEALVTPRTNYEIWEFIANGAVVQRYDADAAQRYRTRAANGPLGAAAGLLILLVGLIALRIKQFRRESRTAHNRR